MMEKAQSLGALRKKRSLKTQEVKQLTEQVRCKKKSSDQAWVH